MMDCATVAGGGVSVRSMVEQPYPGKRHDHTVLVGGLDHVVVADAAARLGDVFDAAFRRALYVVAEGEERVAAQRHAGEPGEEVALFVLGQLLGDEAVYLVVPLGALERGVELQLEYLRVAAQVPDVGLVARQAGAVYAALLSGADADGLAVLSVADAVRLRVLERAADRPPRPRAGSCSR